MSKNFDAINRFPKKDVYHNVKANLKAVLGRHYFFYNGFLFLVTLDTRYLFYLEEDRSKNSSSSFLCLIRYKNQEIGWIWVFMIIITDIYL